LVSTHTADELEELLAESPAVGFLPKKALSASAIFWQTQKTARAANPAAASRADASLPSR
jgi:hypothetical protein